MSEMYSPRSDDAKCLPPRPCPLEDACLRFLRPSAKYQWWSEFENWATPECAGFLPVGEIYAVGN